MSHDQPQSNPYRRVSVATWSDRKVSSLSPLQPSGQALFLMLLVGPQTTNIPGVQPIGRMAFAEALGWELEAFDEAFAEAFREGLVKADWKARLIFVPNAIKHNLPQSPNVVKSWASMWSRVPECDLKIEVWNALHDALLELGEAFAKAFKSACPLGFQGFEEGFPNASTEPIRKPSGKPSPKPSAKTTDNQESINNKQEEVIPPIPPKGGGRRQPKVITQELVDGFEAFYRTYPRKVGKKSAWWKLCPDEALVARIMAALKAQIPHMDRRENGRFIKHPSTWINGEHWNDAVPGVSAAPALSPDGGPPWYVQAGFEHPAEAANVLCHIGNFREFRNGQRIAAEAVA